MVVIETKLDGFNHKLSYDKLNYPQCSCGKCPRFYWNMMNIGARGSGKTYTIVQMIKHYEKNRITKADDGGAGVRYKLRTHLISPTIQANEIYQSLDSLNMDKDAHENYSDKLLLDIIADIKDKKEKYEDYLLYKKYYEKAMKIPESKIEKAYDDNPDMFNLLEKYNYQHPSELEHEDPELNIIILDDLVGSDAFTRKTKSTLVNAMIKNRHMGICFALLVQSIRAVPKNIRLNCSVFQLATFKNKRMVLDDIYEEISNVVGIEDFEELYDYATAKPYGSLIIDTTNGKRFLSNLDSELSLKPLKPLK